MNSRVTTSDSHGWNASGPQRSPDYSAPNGRSAPPGKQGGRATRRRVTEQVRRLAMPATAELEVHIGADDPAGEGVHPLAANPGLGAAPLAKVAWGASWPA